MNDNHFLTPDQAIEWNEYLTEFVAEVYPIFEHHGIGLDTALNCWFNNRLYNVLSENEDDDPDGDWKS